MENTRQLKVSRLIQKSLGEILRIYAKEHLLSSPVSITEVRLSRDLSIARVYVSIFPIGNLTKEGILLHLKGIKPELRKNIGNQLKHQLRIIPDLDFFLDTTMDYAENIDKLLKTGGSKS